MNPFMKRYCLAAFALSLLLVIAAPALADDVRGNIAMIDPDNHTFILVDENSTVLQMQFQVGGQVLVNDRQVTIWDIHPGDRVTVTYYRTDLGGLAATAIECRRVE